MYRELKKLSVRWKPYGGEGLEHLTLSSDDGGIFAESVIAGESDGIAFGVQYNIECDAEWQVRAFAIRTTDGRGISMHSPRPGIWQDVNDVHLPEFDGCIDIDLSGTPFTNTLPIRRCEAELRKGPMEFSMLYVPFNDFVPIRDGQRYTCLDAGRRFLYEATDGTFSAEIDIDEDGLVQDYPPIYRRVCKICGK